MDSTQMLMNYQENENGKTGSEKRVQRIIIRDFMIHMQALQRCQPTGKNIMRFHVFAFSLTVGVIWGAAILLVAAANLIWPNYGQLFLELTASIYPGYHPGTGLGSVITGSLYALVDGTIGGALFAWVYNLLASTTDK